MANRRKKKESRHTQSPKHSVSASPADPLIAVPSRLTLAGILVIVLATTIAYWPCRHGEFLWDGTLLITENQLVKASDGLYRIWFTTESIDYWPVTNSMFWLEWHLWGDNTTGYHAVNLTLQIASSLLIWLILKRLSVPGAFLAALLYAMHPVNIEGVAWIAQLKNCLSLFFFLLSLICYLKADRGLTAERSSESLLTNVATLQPLSVLWYWISVAMFVLAMLSKGSVAMLPVMLLLIIWWRRSKITRIDLTRTAPFFLVAIVLTLVNIWFQTHGTGEISLATFMLTMLSKGSVAVLPIGFLLIAWFRRGRIVRVDLIYTVLCFLVAAIILTLLNIWVPVHGSNEIIRFVTPLQRLLGAGAVPWFYLYKALLPINLSFVYPQWYVHPDNILWWLPLCASIAITVLLFWQRNRPLIRPLFVAWLFFCVALLPVMGLSDVYFMKFSLVADHYQYIAMIAVLTLVAAALSYLKPKPLAIGVGVFLAGTCGALAFQQTYKYVDGDTLYQSILAKNPNCWLAYNNQGVLLLKAGHVDEAIASYEKALAMDANMIEAQNNLGAALAKKGDYQGAIEHYNQALTIKPNYADAHGNLGLALAQIGNQASALDELQTAFMLNPNLPNISFNLALQLKQMGRNQEALKQYQQTVRMDPDNARVRNNLGALLINLSQPEQAKEQCLEAIRLDPDQPEAHYNLANALVELHQTQAAVEQYNQALKIDPHYAAAHRALGKLYLGLKQLPAAIAELHEALAENPDNADTHSFLGGALAMSGDLEKAIEHDQRALQLKPDYVEAQANLAMVQAQSNHRAEAIAAAERAISLAQAQNKTAMAAQLQKWLTDYRNQSAAEPNPTVPPAGKSNANH
jgi:protein O-mannosyl-transferase